MVSKFFLQSMVITKFAEQNLFQMRVFSNTNLYIRGRNSKEKYFETNLKLISKIHLTGSNITVKKVSYNEIYSPTQILSSFMHT